MADGELYTVFVDSSPALPLPLQASDEIAVVRGGVTYKVAPTDISGGGIGFTTYIAPLTGDTITAVIGQGAFEILPAAGIAALTMVLPPSPADEGIFEAATTNTIAALTTQPAAGDSVVSSAGGPYTLGANGSVRFRYRLSNTTWYPA
jgi:hypothetical protein